MREAQLTIPELAIIAGSRAALGAGLGLLLSNRLPDAQRKAIGWTLFLFGAAISVPLAYEVMDKLHEFIPADRPERIDAGR